MSNRKVRVTVTPEMKTEMQALRDKGITLKDIADQFNVTPATVGSNTTNPKIPEMQKMRDKGAASDNIARKFGVTRDYVLKHTKGFADYERVKEEAKGGTVPDFVKMEEPIKIEGRGKDPEKKVERAPMIVGSKRVREETKPEQEQATYPGKDTAGKIQLSLVPPGIIEAVGEVRTFGCKKYGAPDNWKTVKPELYVDALMRHLVRYLRDPKATDEESGLSHLWHLATNAAFLIEIEMEADVNENL